MPDVSLRRRLQDAVRPSTTRSVPALVAKSVLNALLFFGVFMLALPWLAHRLLPTPLPLPPALGEPLAALLAAAGFLVWGWCLVSFSRVGGGTPLPADAPRHLVTSGAFSFLRNPIMAAELAVIWALALHVASWGLAVYAFAITIAAHLSVVLVEEPELRRRFGPEYETYCRDVPRWLPRRRDATT